MKQATPAGGVSIGSSSISVSSSSASANVPAVNSAAAASLPSVNAIAAQFAGQLTANMPNRQSNWGLDEDSGRRAGVKGGGGTRMDSTARHTLMAKLAAGAGMDMPAVNAPATDGAGGATSLGASGSNPAGLPSRFCVAVNMFDAAEETEADWALDIQEDVGEEVAKHGTLEECHVDSRANPPLTGAVYLRFQQLQSAVAAAQALHGRWFGKRLVSVMFLTEGEYDAKRQGW